MNVKVVVAVRQCSMELFSTQPTKKNKNKTNLWRKRKLQSKPHRAAVNRNPGVLQVAKIAVLN